MSHTIVIDGSQLPVIIRKHPRSRRMTVRYQPLQNHVSLSLPRYVSIRQGLRFVEEKSAWLAEQIRENSKRIPIADGHCLPILGNIYTVRHAGGRGIVTINESQIMVHGDASFMKRRMLDWIKSQLKNEITRLSQAKVLLIEKALKRITLRDTSSCWGSCSHDGNLSFSWRLVFAPYEVLDYVVSHEVAHIKHHNHSPAFWETVGLLCPDYKKYRHWLKNHGAELYLYG